MSTIGGIPTSLPFGGMASNAGLISSSGLPGAAGLGGQYANSYQNALALNSTNYQNIMTGYANTGARQQALQGQIQQGYGNVLGGIQSTLGQNYGAPGVNGNWGIAGPAAQAIQNTGQQQNAAILQNQQSRGLGNSTITGNLQNQSAYNTQSALAGLGAQLGQTYAGYQANLGLSGLGFANQANLQNTSLSEAQLGAQERVNAPYPQASQYASLLQQAGSYQQYLQQQRQQQQYLNRALGAGIGAGGSPQISHLGQLGSSYSDAGGQEGGGPTLPNYGSKIAYTPDQAAQSYNSQVLNQAYAGGQFNSPQGQIAMDQFLGSQNPGSLQIGDAYSTSADSSGYGDYSSVGGEF